MNDSYDISYLSCPSDRFSTLTNQQLFQGAHGLGWALLNLFAFGLGHVHFLNLNNLW